MREPAVVSTPAWQNRSLRPTGTPSIGDSGALRARRSSAALAAAPRARARATALPAGAGTDSLEDPRDDERAAVLLGRLAQHLVAGKARPDLVVAHHGFRLAGVAGEGERLDAFDVHRLQPLDVLEHVPELSGGALLLLLRQREALYS